MVEQVLTDLYRIEIPLPNNPLRALNSYFIRGRDRNLLVDTGFNLEACWVAMESALRELEVSMDNTDLFITHYHSDHMGLVGRLSTPTNNLWMSAYDAELAEANYRDHIFRTRIAQHLHHSGLLADGVPNLPGEEAVVKYASRGYAEFTKLKDGDLINIGNYRFSCLETPGHTHGHMCLYEPKQKILIAGDHILDKITPNIGLWVLQHDALGEYLENLVKTASLDVELTLPAHRTLIYDHRKRINEIIQHHEQRIENISKIVSSSRMTTAQIARRMRWDLSYKTWDEYPINQKMHAAAEAMAHLYYMTLKGQITMTVDDGIYYFHR